MNCAQKMKNEVMMRSLYSELDMFISLNNEMETIRVYKFILEIRMILNN